jgi:hypothetical protein
MDREPPVWLVILLVVVMVWAGLQIATTTSSPPRRSADFGLLLGAINSPEAVLHSLRFGLNLLLPN